MHLFIRFQRGTFRKVFPPTVCQEQGWGRGPCKVVVPVTMTTREVQVVTEAVCYDYLIGMNPALRISTGTCTRVHTCSYVSLSARKVHVCCIGRIYWPCLVCLELVLALEVRWRCGDIGRDLQWRWMVISVLFSLASTDSGIVQFFCWIW